MCEENLRTLFDNVDNSPKGEIVEKARAERYLVGKPFGGKETGPKKQWFYEGKGGGNGNFQRYSHVTHGTVLVGSGQVKAHAPAKYRSPEEIIDDIEKIDVEIAKTLGKLKGLLAQSLSPECCPSKDQVVFKIKF